MKTLLALSITLTLLLSTTSDGSEPKATAEEKPLVQIAILLDTSGSMTGLIE